MMSKKDKLPIENNDIVVSVVKEEAKVTYKLGEHQYTMCGNNGAIYDFEQHYGKTAVSIYTRMTAMELSIKDVAEVIYFFSLQDKTFPYSDAREFASDMMNSGKYVDFVMLAGHFLDFVLATPRKVGKCPKPSSNG